MDSKAEDPPSDEFVLVASKSESISTSIVSYESSNGSDIGLKAGSEISADIETHLLDAVKESMSDSSVSEKSDSTASSICISQKEPISVHQEVAPKKVSPRNEELCTYLHGVTFLGSSAIENPTSHGDCLSLMAELKSGGMSAVPFTLTIPVSSRGCVKLVDPCSGDVERSIPVNKILFCCPGVNNVSDCLSFTVSHSNNEMYSCYIFQFALQETLRVAISCFTQAFSLQTAHSLPARMTDPILLTFSVDIREGDKRGTFYSVPREKEMFKLRKDYQKNILINVIQNERPMIPILRCGGVFLLPDKFSNWGNFEMLDDLEFVFVDSKTLTISVNWNPTLPSYILLNSETPKQTKLSFAIAVDIIFPHITEPVRFVVEVNARVYPSNERFFFYTNRKPYIDNFLLKLKSSDANEDGDTMTSSKFQVEYVQSASAVGPFEHKAIYKSNHVDDEDDDMDDFIISGQGTVSQDCAEDVLTLWGKLLSEWTDENVHPQNLRPLVFRGIPDALRGEVWQRLVGLNHEEQLITAFRYLLAQDSHFEAVITRDISRTFPAHDYFKEADGVGQEALLKLTKAYSIYDEEIGYCQGLTYLAAALLLHLPEEQAFCVFVKVMTDYNLREMYKPGFDELYLRFFQLDRLIQEYLPPLHAHFKELDMQPHMFASQWFLTLFTAKFPLFMVYRIIDIVLTEGVNFIFNISVALLRVSQGDLLKLDFEEANKYLRVTVPKRYRCNDEADELIKIAVTIKISERKLQKLAKEYHSMKEVEAQEDPSIVLERERKRLHAEVLRLERENDALARELVGSKIDLRNQLNKTEEMLEETRVVLNQKFDALKEAEENSHQMQSENTNLKQLIRKESEQFEQQLNQKSKIIEEYKDICKRLNTEKDTLEIKCQQISESISSCSKCKEAVSSIDLSSNAAPAIHNISIDDSLEQELAAVKLELVESQCQKQELEHKLTEALAELSRLNHPRHNSLLSKTSTFLGNTFSKSKDVSQ